jgi:hypothetical protein
MGGSLRFINEESSNECLPVPPTKSETMQIDMAGSISCSSNAGDRNNELYAGDEAGEKSVTFLMTDFVKEELLVRPPPVIHEDMPGAGIAATFKTDSTSDSTVSSGEDSDYRDDHV